MKNGIPESYGVIPSDGSNTSLKAVIQDNGPQPGIFIPLRTGVNISNNPVDSKFTEDSNPVEYQYTGVAITYMQVDK